LKRERGLVLFFFVWDDSIAITISQFFPSLGQKYYDLFIFSLAGCGRVEGVDPPISFDKSQNRLNLPIILRDACLPALD